MGEPQDCHYFPSVCLARVCQTLLRAAGRSWYVTLRAFSKLYAQSAEGSACGAGLLGRPYGSPGVSGCLPALEARSPRPRRGQSRPVPPERPRPSARLCGRGASAAGGTARVCRHLCVGSSARACPSPDFCLFKDAAHMGSGHPSLAVKKCLPAREA